jgi:ankyrin repeat protein
MRSITRSPFANSLLSALLTLSLPFARSARSLPSLPFTNADIIQYKINPTSSAMPYGSSPLNLLGVILTSNHENMPELVLPHLANLSKEEAKKQTNETDDYGFTPLIIAAARGADEKVLYSLLERYE